MRIEESFMEQYNHAFHYNIHTNIRSLMLVASALIWLGYVLSNWMLRLKFSMQ